MDYLPAELEPYNFFLDNLPDPENALFLYYLCVLMCEAGKMRVHDEAVFEDHSTVYFETLAGERFHVIRLPVEPDLEAEMIEGLRPIIEAFGWLQN